jgi:dTDP-6-deoxy-L-talose 4-dehydrogenase (NAD+)
VRIAVTGAAGFIGAQVVRRVREGGDEPLPIVRKGSRAGRLGDLPRLHELALEDTEGLRRWLETERPDAVVHLAWYARPQDYLVSPENLASLAVTARLAEAVFGSGCRKLVGVGTCLEYAAADRPLVENDAVDPVSPYASAKHAAFLVARALATRAGAELAWARVFHLYGPGEDATRLVPTVAASLRRGEPVDVTAGEQVRDYLHVADVASGIAALARPGAAGVFNVCSGTARPLREVLLAIGQLRGRADLLRFGARPYPPGEVMHIAGRCDRLRGLGWTPRFANLEAGLEDALGTVP